MTKNRNRPTPLGQLDPVLGPVLRSAASTEPSRIALAVACRAVAAGYTPSVTRRWLAARDPVRCGTITATPRRFSPIWLAARTHVGVINDEAGREKRMGAAASVLVGLLLSAVSPSRSVSPHQAAVARRALAVIGVDVIESIRDQGWDTVLVHAPKLAVRLGVTPVTARRMLATCVEAGWLKLVSKKSGGGARYALPKRIPGPAREAAWGAYDAADALVRQTPGLDDVADLILNAGHPAWGHGERSPKVWTVALADAANVDPTALGVARKIVKPTQREWLSMLAPHEVGAPLVVVLDADATLSGAHDAAARAEAARVEVAAARVKEVTAARVAGEWARSWVSAVLAQHPVPVPTASREDRGEWLLAIQAAVASTGVLDERARRALKRALAGRMSARHGYERSVAERVAQRSVSGTSSRRASQ